MNGTHHMDRLSIAQELQNVLMAHPQRGPIPVQASLITMVINELRAHQSAEAATSTMDSFVEAATRFATAHVNSDRLDALDDQGEAAEAEHAAADREYNSSKAGLVKAFMALMRSAT